jgi:hypothetical protein
MAGVEKVEGLCGCSGLPVRNDPAISVPAQHTVPSSQRQEAVASLSAITGMHACMGEVSGA